MADDSDWYRHDDVLVDVLQRSRDRRPRAPQIDGYDDLRELRRGGQGVVYTAVQRSTQRRVAVKVLSDSGLPAASARWRFEREIDLVAGLRHPNIVSIYDSGQTPDDRPYFVMELVEGVPLDEYIARQFPISDFRFPIGDRHFRRAQQQIGNRKSTIGNLLRLFVKICGAVQHAHQRGVIHRDLKPGNILIDACGEPHVLDFGVAKPTEARAVGSGSAVTTAGGFLGTLAYAAPEQLAGDPSLVDVRTDVYALGLLFYALLTGRHPYPITGSVAEVVEAITKAEPVRPSRLCHRPAPSPLRVTRFVASWLRGSVACPINDETDTIALKALAKDPQQRYQSVEALRQDIEHYEAGEPIEAKRSSTAYVLKKLLWRHRLAAAVTIAFLVSLTGFGGAMAYMYEQARSEADKVKQINYFLEDTLGSVEARAPIREATVRELLDEGVQWVDFALSDRPETEAAVRAILGNGYRNLGVYDDAERELQAALDLRRREYGDEHLDVAASLSGLASLRRDQGRHEVAERLLQQALAIRSKLLGDDHLDVAMTVSSLAQVLRDRGDLEQAERMLRSALSIRRGQLGDRHPDVAMAQFNLAQVLESRGLYSEALQLHRAALATRRAVLHAGHPDIPRSLLALGALLIRAGDAAAADPLLRECLSIHQRSLPLDHWRVAEANSVLGGALTALGRFAEAEPLVRDGYAGLQAALRPGDERIPQALERVVALYEAWGRPDDADAYRAMLPAR